MNKIIGEPKRHNGRWYQIVNVVDIATDDNNLIYEELEFVKVKMKLDFILFRFWITIKSYKVNENNTLKNQIAKAKRLLNTITKD